MKTKKSAAKRKKLPHAARKVLRRHRREGVTQHKRYRRIVRRGAMRDDCCWVTDDDVEGIVAGLDRKDHLGPAWAPRVRHRMQRRLVRLMRERIWPRWIDRDVDVLFVTVIARRFRFPTRDLDLDVAAVKKFVANIFGRDGVSYVGFVEVAPVTTNTGTKGHARFDLMAPHAHLVMWGPPEAIRRVKLRAPGRCAKERAGPDDNPPVVAKWVPRRDADLARTTCYTSKTDRFGKRLYEGRWMKLPERMPLAALVDLYRVLSPYALTELMVTSGEGEAIRQELVFGPDRRRRPRRG